MQTGDVPHGRGKAVGDKVRFLVDDAGERVLRCGRGGGGGVGRSCNVMQCDKRVVVFGGFCVCRRVCCCDGFSGRYR